ncbi:MAG: heparinase II/III family protein, partial [Pseudomonadales bacterium]
MTAITRLARKTLGLQRLGRLRDTLLGRNMRSVLKFDDGAFLKLFEVESVAAALARADVDAAADALIDHYRARTTPEWPPFPVHMTNVARLSSDELSMQAERLLEHRFELAAEPEVRFGDRIDWNYDPTSDPRRRWARELHRHRWVAVLGASYQQTGDERCAEKFVQLISDWIQSNPPPATKNEAHIVWTLMGVGMRCSVWPTAFSVFFDSPAFDRACKLLMLRSICDHARFLYLFKTHDNHLLRESNGLAAIAASFPEFKAAESWQQRALERLAQELELQINPDGSHIEMSTGYQWLVAEEFEATLDIMQRVGWCLPFGHLHESLQRIYTMLVQTCRPDGSWPQLSDGFMEGSPQLRERLAIAGAKLAREDFTFIATAGRDGLAPQSTSTLLPFGGLAIMRSDWSLDALYLLMDCGPFGGVHGHEDKLSIEVCAYGQPFLIDPGTYTYNGN